MIGQEIGKRKEMQSKDERDAAQADIADDEGDMQWREAGDNVTSKAKLEATPNLTINSAAEVNKLDRAK